ncbi:hypothetical protein [Pseudoduganella namucuonensis]|uniref:Uncharacterized protein n=1 Tax=Pseudoduganella namucuonensis TaxID=1035707 RepID=A0A1I7LW20_9BURK|nr:hypothetical protein [Pseudoduganella namucuonensis]SFV13908.1 hypothetical protein SAMN05216552_104040 [Pseudoduganella namucuonensis]
MTGVPLNLVSMGHISHMQGAGAPAPAQGTPEQHFANHLQDHYGMQMQNYNQNQLAHHANHFATQHGCGGMQEMQQMQQLIQHLMAELSFLKHGAPPSAPPTPPNGPGHETLLQAQDRLTQQEVDTKAHIRMNEEKLAVAELETKMAKKMRDSILQSI